MREIILGKNDGGQRLDKFISKCTVGLPVPLMYKYIRKKCIKVNGVHAKENTILHEGDRLEMYISDEFFADDRKSAHTGLASVKKYPDIIYEDENIILCDKRPGVLVHDGDDASKGSVGTLIHSIQAYLYSKGEYDPDAEKSFAPALCNRIDRNTGGIVIAAKNAAALRSMNEMIRNKAVRKKYLCVVHGKMPRSSGILKNYLFKNSKTKTVTVYDDYRRGSKEAVSMYRSIAYNSDMKLSLLEIELVTGRTHQIRAQMAYAGHPLLGEGKYFVNRGDAEIGWRHQALYSYKVEFVSCSNELSYLKGKEFSIPLKNVEFLKYFGDVRRVLLP